ELWEKNFQPPGAARSPIKKPEPPLQSADETACSELGQRLYDRTQSPRESQKNIEALQDSGARSAILAASDKIRHRNRQFGRLDRFREVRLIARLKRLLRILDASVCRQR